MIRSLINVGHVSYKGVFILLKTLVTATTSSLMISNNITCPFILFFMHFPNYN